MKKKLIGILIILAIFITALAYLALLVFSESVTYSKSSVEYYLLTPQVLKGLPLEEVETAEYYYSAADGNKPTINSIELSLDGEKQQINNKLSGFFTANNYTISDDGFYKKGATEVSVEYQEEDGVRVKVTVFEYLE